MLSRLSPQQVGVLTGNQFFPHLISGPFHHGLMIVFTAAAIMSFIGALVSLLRGKQFFYDDPGSGTAASAAARPATGPAVTSPAVTQPGGHRPGGHRPGGRWDGPQRQRAQRERRRAWPERCLA